MKKYFYTISIVVLHFTSVNLKAQGWGKSYIDSSGIGIGRDVKQTFDGGFYFTCYPGQLGIGQTAKLDANGNVNWTTTIGGISLV